jgi:hypothetical protein
VFSRIDKLLRETTGADSLAEAHALRERDVELLVGAGASPALVRPATALALRCFSGAVLLKPEVGASEGAVASAQLEAVSYGVPERLRVGPSAGPTVQVGLSVAPGAAVTADASGWEAGVNVSLPARRAPTTPAAAFAAAAAFGKVFARLLGAPEEISAEAWAWSLRTFGPAPDSGAAPPAIDLGRVTLLGAGAIGSSFAYVVHLTDWAARLGIIDFDRYDDPNHETTLLISQADAFRQRPKAATLAERAARPGLETTHLCARVRAGHAAIAEAPDAFVCAVDDEDTRLELDGCGARTLFNAGVGGTAADAGHVLWTRHGDTDGDLAPLYARRGSVTEPTPSRPPAEVANDACSSLHYEGVAMAAPFIGLAAGALLVAGVAQQALADAPDTNYVKLDLMALQARYLRLRRRRARAA